MALALSAASASAAITLPDQDFGDGGSVELPRASGELVAVSKGVDGRIVLATVQRINRSEDRDSTIVRLSMVDREGKLVRSFGDNGTVKYRARGMIYGLKLAVGIHGSVTIAQISSRFEDYVASYHELRVLRFNRLGRRDFKFAPQGTHTLVNTDKLQDSGLDSEWLTIAVDRRDNAFILANESETVRRVHAIDAEGKVRREYTKRTRRVFPEFPRGDWQAGKIAEVTSEGELLIEGVLWTGESFPLPPDNEDITLGVTGGTVLIDRNGNGSQTFGKSGFLRAPATPWVHDVFAAVRLTSRGVAAIVEEDHPFARPAGTKGRFPWMYVSRWRFRTFGRDGTDQPLADADIDGGVLIERPAFEERSYVNSVAVGHDGSGAIMRKVARSTRYQISLISPSGVIEVASPFSSGLSNHSSRLSLLDPDSRSVTFAGRSAENSQSLVIARFRVPE